MSADDLKRAMSSDSEIEACLDYCGNQMNVDLARSEFNELRKASNERNTYRRALEDIIRMINDPASDTTVLRRMSRRAQNAIDHTDLGYEEER